MTTCWLKNSASGGTSSRVETSSFFGNFRFLSYYGYRIVWDSGSEISNLMVLVWLNGDEVCSNE